MRLLLPGRHGYFGTVLAPMLRDAGYEVVGLDTSYFEPCLLPGTPADDGVPTLRRDLQSLHAE